MAKSTKTDESDLRWKRGEQFNEMGSFTLLIVACLVVSSICMATTISTVDCSIQTRQSAIEASSHFIKPQTLAEAEATSSLSLSSQSSRQTEKGTLGE